MTRHATATVLALAHWLVVLGPAVVIAGAARKGGLAWTHGLDLVAASAVIGALHGWSVWRRVRRVAAGRRSLLDAAIASLNGLVVLALLSAALVFVLLGGLAPEYAAALNKGWHILATWIGVQVVAVGTAAAVSRRLRAWLAREPPEPGTAPGERTAPGQPVRSTTSGDGDVPAPSR